MEKAKSDAVVEMVDGSKKLIRELVKSDLSSLLFTSNKKGEKNLVCKKGLVSESNGIVVERRVFKWGNQAEACLYDLPLPVTFDALLASVSKDNILDGYVNARRVEADHEQIVPSPGKKIDATDRAILDTTKGMSQDAKQIMAELTQAYVTGKPEKDINEIAKRLKAVQFASLEKSIKTK